MSKVYPWLASSQTRSVMDMLLIFWIGADFSTFELPRYTKPRIKTGVFKTGFFKTGFFKTGFFKTGFAENLGKCDGQHDSPRRTSPRAPHRTYLGWAVNGRGNTKDYWKIMALQLLDENYTTYTTQNWADVQNVFYHTTFALLKVILMIIWKKRTIKRGRINSLTPQSEWVIKGFPVSSAA